MDIRKKKQLFLIGGIALAVLVVVIVLIAVFSGGSEKQYQKHYDAAEAAYLRRDYTAAINELSHAIEDKPTEEAYLMMANAYYAEGDAEQAIQVLYLGYSRVGGSAISEMLDRLKRESEGKNETPVPEDGAVTVAGKRFGADTVSVVLSGKDLTNEDFALLCTLPQLENLSVSDNDISDLSPVVALKNLTSLQISNNAVSDLTALSSLSGLKTLYLDGNPIRDLTPLYRLSELKTLSMKNIELAPRTLSDLREALPGCSVFADIDEYAVTEITLGGRTFSSDMTELNLGGLGLTDISALSACRALVKLDLRDNKISDLSPLVELQNLEWLCLWNNEITDVTPLMSLTKLTYLDLDTNQISGITALEYLTGMEDLWLNNNPIRRFTALERLTGLTRLGLKNTGLKDEQLELLYGLDKLRELTLDDNEDLTANKVEELQEQLPECVISHSKLLWTLELGGVTYRSDATEIDASGRGVTDLTGIEHFDKLEKLNLDDNAVADLSPLYELKQLRSVSLRNNGLDPETVDALRAELPRCEVVSDPITWADVYAEFLSSGNYLRQGQTYYSGADNPVSAALRDLDGDGAPELILTNGSDVEADATSYVYTAKEGKIVWLGSAGSRIGSFLCLEDAAYPGLYWQNGNMGYYPGYYYYVRNGALQTEYVLVEEQDPESGETAVTRQTGDTDLFDACVNAQTALPTIPVAQIESGGWAAFAARYGF